MKWLTFRDHKWLILKKVGWSWNMNITFLQGKCSLTWRELRSLITGALRASDFDPIMKNMHIIQSELERASVLFRKWKGGREDESILKEKWLTFHDHKWLTFKRPLTGGQCRV